VPVLPEAREPTPATDAEESPPAPGEPRDPSAEPQ
jgi:hypothetical protein